jgi:glycosyltransferase involved in cell wall biosynthesis
MRIVQTVLSLGIGGQERLMLRIVAALQKRGHDVQIVTFTPGGALLNEVGSTPVHVLDFSGSGKGGFDPTLPARLWRLYRSLRPDVVHTHNATPLVYGALAGRLARAHVIHTKHGNDGYTSRSLPLARVASRFVHHFVAVSDDTAVIARKTERPSRAALTVIENGIPLDAFARDARARDEIRDELGIPREALVVGSVGRLNQDKDYPLLVRAMEPMLSDRVRLVLVGEGPARAPIEAAISAASRPFVVLAGARRDVPKVLSALDVFAMSSKTEGLPLALAEAMTAELPVVATAVGGVPTVVPKGAGILVAHGDAPAMTAAIRRLLDDPQTRTEMGAAGRAYALGRYSEDRMLADYFALYAGAASRSARRSG